MIAELQTGQLNGNPVRSLSIDALPTSESGWPLRPFKIVSLLEMIKFRGSTFFAISGVLAELPNLEVSDPEFSSEGENAWDNPLEMLEDMCAGCGLQLSVISLQRLREDIKRSEIKNWSQFTARIPEIHSRISDELSLHLFMQIPRDRVDYFQKTDLFGEIVAQNFPSSNSDIEEAGSCYATDRNTACVFHSMRALEHGLRALAASLNVSFPTPIELENWQNIIEKVESEIKAINNQPKGLQKTSDLQFYSEAAKEFRYFKDAWRNHVSHSREKYGDAEAYRVLTHVKDFMQHLATRLKE
jgi:hypothetical protein